MLTEAPSGSSIVSAMASEDRLSESARTHSVIGAFFEVYNSLGYGFVERVYSRALELELLGRGHRVAREVSVSISYKGRQIARQRLDMIIDDTIVVELKSTAALPPGSLRQVFSYLRATHLRIGLLFHFGPMPAVRRADLRKG
jgi:GxxExxY protein